MPGNTFDVTLMECNQTTLDELRKTTLLSAEDLDKLRECLPAAQDAFNKVQMFRTVTEMRVSVLNDTAFPTADAKYWQCIREMDAMAGNLIGLSFSYAEKMIDLDELETTPLPEDLHARKRLELSIKKKEFEITCIQREAHHRIREIAEWKKIQDELRPMLGAGTEDVNAHQIFSLAYRFLKEYSIAETGHVNKDLDSYRNLCALTASTLGVISRMKLMPDFLKMIGRDPELVKFARKKRLIPSSG